MKASEKTTEGLNKNKKSAAVRWMTLFGIRVAVCALLGVSLIIRMYAMSREWAMNVRSMKRVLLPLAWLRRPLLS